MIESGKIIFCEGHYYISYYTSDITTDYIWIFGMIEHMAVRMAAIPLDSLLNASVARAFCMLLLFIVGYNNLLMVYILLGIFWFLTGNKPIILTSMFADCIEYNQWHLGERMEGLIFFLQSSSAKIIFAIGGAALCFSLGAYGYVPNQEQSEVVKFVIYSCLTISPALGSILSIIAIPFYSLTEEKNRDFVQKLKTQQGL